MSDQFIFHGQTTFIDKPLNSVIQNFQNSYISGDNSDRNDQDLTSDFVNKQTTSQVKKETAVTQLFQQAQNIADVTLRENVQRALNDLNEEMVDVGLFLLGREFETTIKTFIRAAHARGKLANIPANKNPDQLKLAEMISCLKINGIITDDAALSYLRQQRNDRAHGSTPTLAERRVLMNNVQHLASLYIDYIKLLDDLFKQTTS
jgi:hypothetical protein